MKLKYMQKKEDEYLEGLYNFAFEYSKGSSLFSIGFDPIQLGAKLGFNSELSRSVAINLTNNKKLSSTLGLGQVRITEYGISYLENKKQQMNYNAKIAFYLNKKEYEGILKDKMKYKKPSYTPYIRIQEFNRYNENTFVAFIQGANNGRWEYFCKNDVSTNVILKDYEKDECGALTIDCKSFYLITECALNANDIYEFTLTKDIKMNQENKTAIDGQGNIVIQNSSNVQITQTNNNHQITNHQIKEFLQFIKNEIENSNLDESNKDEFNDIINYSNRQITNEKVPKAQLLELGNLIKDVGVNTFANLLASPIFEIIKPMLGF